MRILLLWSVCALTVAASLASAMDLNVTTAAELQSALSAAVPGDRIILQAGATFSGTFTLPNKSGAGWITLQSSALTSLPPAGTRVTPAYRAYMPKIVATYGNPAFVTAQAAHSYQLIGLEIVAAPNTYSYNLVSLGTGLETNLDQIPYNFVLDRLYIHGDPVAGTKRGITLNSKSTVIKNSYISDIKSTTQDAQAIMGWNGPGPYQILNNYLEATGENIMFGGGTANIPNLVPSDIEVRHNYLFKPLSWRPGDPSYAGTNWWVKNLFELKNARRVVVDGNIMENCWESQQRGAAVLFTVRTELMAMPWAVVEDVAFTNNIIRHVGTGFEISGSDNDRSGKSRRIRIENNLFEDINSVKWGGLGRMAVALNGVDDLTFNHNTGFQNGDLIDADNPIVNKNLSYTNNLTPIGGGIFGSGVGQGLPALAYYYPGATVTGNVMIGGSASLYPPGNYFPASITDVGFQNVSAGDYHLTAQSPYHNAGTDGKDIGADINTLNAATAGVTTSVTPPSGVPSVSISPLSMSLSAGQTLQFSSLITGVPNTNTIWRITPEIGTISATGLYTAPSVVYATATITVTAFSAADVTQWAAATITLGPGGTQTFAPIHINAGGLGYTDSSGITWSTDSGEDVVGNATSTTNPINGTFNPTLYITQRYASTLQYSFAVPNATYTLKLKFAELAFNAAGKRAFNIVINGQTVESNLDVFAVAGAQFTALDKTYTATVTDNRIVIQLVGVVSSAILSGLEILPAGTAPAPAFSAIRVNAGGSAVVDAAGNTWSADTGSTSGATYSVYGSVTGTTTPSLYRSERWAGGTVQYQFPVPSSSYTTTLKFAEIYFTAAGQRVFNIVINGSTVESNFDVFAAAGGAFKAIDRSYTVNVTNGAITIQFVPVVSNPKISAIEIVQAQPSPSSPPPSTFTPVRVNAGGATYVDASGNSWAADSGSSSYTYSVVTGISGTTTPALYQTERWSSTTLQYPFAAPDGTYTVTLKFAEIYFTAPGQRVFNIVLNGQTVETNFDVFAAAGGAFRAIDKTYAVNASNGSILIQLVPVVSNPKISAIEILAGGTAPPSTTMTPVRINAGGAGLTDSAGTVWKADTGYTNGSTYATTAAIGGTSTPAIYQTERWASNTLQYQVPAVNGTRTVNLKFAEIYFSSAGQRIFNIVINGQTVASNVDIVAAAGGPNRALDKQFQVNVTGGLVTIQLVPVVSNPKISGIEIY